MWPKLLANEVLTAALQRSTNLQIIAEFKSRLRLRFSINVTADAVELSKAFENAGAAAISVLTDLPYFGGKMSDLETVRDAVTMPVLRRDFIVDPYQLWESKAFGADLVFCSLQVTGKSKLQNLLLALARDFGYGGFAEVHDVDDIDKNTDLPGFIGVKTGIYKPLKTSIDRSISLAPIFQLKCHGLGKWHSPVQGTWSSLSRI